MAAKSPMKLDSNEKELLASLERGERKSVGGGRGHIDGTHTLWAATAKGLGRIKDGHASMLTTADGLPCDTVHCGSGKAHQGHTTCTARPRRDCLR